MANRRIKRNLWEFGRMRNKEEDFEKIEGIVGNYKCKKCGKYIQGWEVHPYCKR